MGKQAQTLTRDAIQYETKRDFSTSPHNKQNKRFLATTTAPNTESRKYTYELLLTSADRLLLSKSITLHFYLLLALKHTFLLITINQHLERWYGELPPRLSPGSPKVFSPFCHRWSLGSSGLLSWGHFICHFTLKERLETVSKKYLIEN